MQVKHEGQSKILDVDESESISKLVRRTKQRLEISEQTKVFLTTDEGRPMNLNSTISKTGTTNESGIRMRKKRSNEASTENERRDHDSKREIRREKEHNESSDEQEIWEKSFLKI